MHELSIVSSLLEIITEDAQKKGLRKITFVRLVIGELSSANPRDISFALEHLMKGTMLSEAVFEVAVEEARSTCEYCSFIFKPSPPFFLCPSCGKGASLFVKGREIYIDYYEGE